jgi:oxygen-dependent protoporphyrinogen oxidase
VQYGQDLESVDVAVVGAGISGLAAALQVGNERPETVVTVLEAGQQAGGVLHTTELQGLLLESSADSFITNVPWAVDLCRRVGLESELIPTDAAHRRAFIVAHGRLESVPDGLLIMAPSRIGPLLTTRILSPWGKLRAACEILVPRGNGNDESLAHFARRRLGREAYERLIQPLVGGMYTGDPERLSTLATLPRFLEMEQEHGSLVRAARRGTKSQPSPGSTGSGARYGMFASLKRGMGQLVEAVVRHLPPHILALDSPVEALHRTTRGSWLLKVAGTRPRNIEARSVVLASPARIAGRLLNEVQPEAATQLAGIESTSCAVVSLSYRADQVGHPLNGFGFVVPFVEERSILSGSFSSVKFAGRAPEGQHLFRVFVGGSRRPDLLRRDDTELVALASRELAELLSIRGDPQLGQVDRWPDVMPQYHLGHRERVASIHHAIASLGGSLALAGNYLTGVGVPHCIHNGQEAARRVVASLAAQEPSSPAV